MKWLLVVLIALQAHFAASYLVPLDEQARREFGGLLPWAWPWEVGHRGVLGPITEAGPPAAGLLFALGAAALSVMAIMAVVGLWVPLSWWRLLAAAGAILTILLMVLFLGPTRLLPIAVSLVVLWGVWAGWLAAPSVP